MLEEGLITPAQHRSECYTGYDFRPLFDMDMADTAVDEPLDLEDGLPDTGYY